MYGCMVEGPPESSYCSRLAFRHDVIAAVQGFKYFNESFLLYFAWLLAKAAVLNILISEWETWIKGIKNGTQLAHIDDPVDCRSR